jgi:pilus assembly protein CpaE
MPDDARIAALPEDGAAGSGDRAPLLAFIADGASEAILREVLGEVALAGVTIRRGNVRAAIAALTKTPTPQALIVDVSGEDRPLTALGDLSEVVEPDVRVLVIGEEESLNFYRLVTRHLGALEYLYKPLTRDMVARHFLPLLTGAELPADNFQGGRMVTITGVRGGAGASTIAAHLAWHFGVAAGRHTVLLDADLHFGTAALLLDGKASAGLRTALEAPQRIDELFVERAAQPVSGRLFVLAGEETPDAAPVYAEAAGEKLIEALRRRYNLIIADVPPAPLAFNHDLLGLGHHRVLVLPPTLAGVRDTLRLLALPHGRLQPRRPILVLNRLGAPGSLTRAQIEAALKLKIDVVIPDLPRQMARATALGAPASGLRGGFRAGILALAKEVAFVKVPDEIPAPGRRRRWFGWRR